MLRRKLITRACLIIAGLVIVNGCARLSAYNTSFAAVNPASVVYINKSYEVPHQRARIFIQFGEHHPTKNTIDKYFPYCSIQVQNLTSPGEPNKQVKPGRFQVYEVRQFNDWIPIGGTYVASLTMTMEVDNRIRPSDVIYQVQMRMRSPEQPDVVGLICVKHSDEPFRSHGYYPSLAEMRTALGDAVDIEPPT